MIIKVNGAYLERFTVLQLFGFIVLIFGIVVFNELVILPFKFLKVDDGDD
jgi:hypothetical protein